MKQIVQILSAALFFVFTFYPGKKLQAQVIDIIGNPNTSTFTTLGVNSYHASENIYTEAEIGAANFLSPATAINQVAFNINAVGTSTVFNNVTIWMKEVPAATTTLATGTYTTTGYTQVFTGTLNIPAIGWLSIPLTTVFQRTNGNNLQVLIERSDNATHPGYSYRTANGNNTSAAAITSRRYNGTAALSASTSLSGSAFRSQIRLQHVYANDALVQQVYTLGKLPVPFSTPHTIKANISNVGANTLTNLAVTLNITGANTFTNIQNIPSLAAGANVDVTFAAFSPLIQGTNNIDVSIPADDFTGNNLKSVTQIVNNNTFSYAYSSVPDGSAGIVAAPFTGDFVAKYNTAVPTAISQVSVYFAAGGEPFQVGIWDATGVGGTPRNLLFTSATQTSAIGVYVLPVLPAVSIPSGDFFVGVRQVDVNNIRFAYQTEDPVRTNTFFLTQPTGGSVWTDLAPAFKFRFMIEPKLQLPTDANLSAIITPSASCNTGTVSYSAVVSNVGLNTIAAGTANVTLKIRGANVYNATIANSTNIASGTSETIFFNGVNLANAGVNSDTAYVVLAGDTEQSNDTLKTSNTSVLATPITAFPAVETAEAALPLFPNFASVTGSSQLWQVQSANYTNTDQVSPLAPHGGNNFYLFDSYGGPNSAGFISRLYSNCVAVPANSGSNCDYSLSFYMSHDNVGVRSQLDSLYVSVSVDNGSTWTRMLPGYQRYDASYATPGWQKLEKSLSAYAGQTIQIGFEGVSKYGNAFGLDDITIASVAAKEVVLSPASNNGIQLTKICDDQGWTYYSTPAAPGVALMAVNWDPTNTGENVAAKTAAVPTIQVDATYFSAEDIPAKKATYTMRRYWNINTGATSLTAPVNLRFFYDVAEKTAVDNAAATFAAANAAVVETGTWFKTVGTAFVNDVTHVSPDGVNGSLPLTNVNVTGATINGVLYAQFNGIASFSGGTYATGVGTNSPLPVSLTNFSVKRTGKINQLSWTTNQEINTKHFAVERSVNGRNYSDIGKVTAAGNSSNAKTYAFQDKAPTAGINYYRLRIVDLDNSNKYSHVRSVRNLGSVDVSIYPNPTRDELRLNITADNSGKGEIVLSDISGKILVTRSATISSGSNMLTLDISRFARGIYFVKITFTDDVITKKFNKL